MHRGLNAVLLTSLLSASALASESRRVLLVPLDDRPATGQFAQMIGSIAGVDVEMPPVELLGRFTTPGDPERILSWLESQPADRYDAIFLNVEMMLYGGLIASREGTVSVPQARERLRKLLEWRNSQPGVPVSLFSSIMRLAPTSTVENAPFRDVMTKLLLVRERLFMSFDLPGIASYYALASRVPAGELESYNLARLRNRTLQMDLMGHVSRGGFDFLMVGQDDAQAEGPQIRDNRLLRERASALGIDSKAFFCEGIDQLSNMMVSRWVTQELKWSPRVRTVLSDPMGAKIVPAYEATTVEQSLREQIVASGGIPVAEGEPFDYSLYVNTPSPRPTFFQQFAHNLATEIEQGFPVAVADINLGKTGTADPSLYSSLTIDTRAAKLLSYAGWNTSGNTLGTAIPAANVYLASRILPGVNPLERETQHRSFLLHRLVNDFEYHRFTRPQAYALLDQQGARREEAYGAPYDTVNSFVQQDMRTRLEQMFQQQFAGQRFFAGPREFEFTALKNVEVALPWPRAYEVKIAFGLQTREVPVAGQ